MSNDVKKPIQLEAIQMDSIIDLQISGGFYKRLQDLMPYLSQKEGLDKFSAALVSIKAGEPKTEFEYHLLTVMTLIFEIEKNAGIQKKLKMVDLPEQPPK